jgi:hypothetical protein
MDDRRARACAGGRHEQPADAMTSAVIVLLALVATLAVAFARTPLHAYCWVYLPVLAVLPQGIVLNLPGFPDLSTGKMSILALALATWLSPTRRGRTTWRFVDSVPACLVLSFSISYGMQTDFMGFVHMVTRLALDWGLPYYVTRTLITDTAALKACLTPLALIAVALGVMAVYECRFAARPLETFWARFDSTAVPQLSYAEQWRWGYLRAHTHFDHPLTMASFFVCTLPLVLLRGVLHGRIGSHALLAMAVVAGVVASLSRGPISGMVAVVLAFTAARHWPRAFLWTLALGLMALLTPAMAVMGDVVRETEQGLQEFGNVDSGYYRVALVLLYGTRLGDYGWWGNPAVVAADYEAAWSIDNSYIFQFIMGGLIGGLLFAVFTLWTIASGYRRILRSSGRTRVVMCCVTASFTGMAVCLANVWFCPDIATFYWIAAGLVVGSRAFASPGAAAPRPTSVDATRLLRPRAARAIHGQADAMTSR